MLRLLIFPHQPCLRISVADYVPSDVFLTSPSSNRNWFSGYSVSRGFFAVAPVRCAQFSPPVFLRAPPYPRFRGYFRKTVRRLVSLLRTHDGAIRQPLMDSVQCSPPLPLWNMLNA